MYKDIIQSRVQMQIMMMDCVSHICSTSVLNASACAAAKDTESQLEELVED